MGTAFDMTSSRREFPRRMTYRRHFLRKKNLENAISLGDDSLLKEEIVFLSDGVSISTRDERGTSHTYVIESNFEETTENTTNCYFSEWRLETTMATSLFQTPSVFSCSFRTHEVTVFKPIQRRRNLVHF